MSKKQTIVIYRLGSLGDTIVALPCFNAVAKRFPDARRVILTNYPVSSKAAPLLAVLGENGGLVDGVIAYPLHTRSPVDFWRLIKKLRALKADTLIFMMADRGALKAWRDWLFFKVAGFKKIMAFPATVDLRKNRVDPLTGIEEPEAERLARCFVEFGPIDLNDPSAWDLHLSPKEREVGHEIVAPLDGRPYIAVNMGGKAAQKDWGLANWQALFTRLKVDFNDYGILVVGADVDSERAQEFSAGWGDPAVNACGKLSPRESAAAMERAAVFIGHDSGPLHLAAAMGVPCIGLFGNFNRPNKWHPRGKTVAVIHNMAGIMAIEVEEVESVLVTILGKCLPLEALTKR